jgi:hypothetical protein
MPEEGADEPGFDLLAVTAISWWVPVLETICEICLREAELGRRVGFVFLDIENVDEFPEETNTLIGSWIYAARRQVRLKKVRRIEAILSSRGVTVIPSIRPSSRSRLTCSQAGIDSIPALRQFRFEGAALGLGALSSLIFRLMDSEPAFAENRALIDRLLTSSFQAYDLTRGLLAQFRPTRVLVYNGRFACSKGIWEAARLSGAEVWFHENVSTYERFYYSPLPVSSAASGRAALRDGWARAGEDREAIAAKFFSPGRGGAPILETTWRNPEDRTDGRSLPSRGLRRIVFFVSSIDEYAAVDNAVDQVLFDSQRSTLEWLISWTRERPDTELIIRVHPRMLRLAARERGWWDSLASENVIVVPAESPVDSYALALSADRVVCFHSSLGAESTYLGKVSILVGDASYRGLDCVYEPDSNAELERMLEDDSLSPKPKENCLPFGYRRLMGGEEFRFYQPASFSEGSLFGEQVAPLDQLPPFRRQAVRVLYKIGKSIQSRRLGPQT